MKNLITILLLFVGLAAMGQIPINTNFDVSTPNPIDGRMTIATLDDTSTIASLYAGLLTVTEDTGEIWVYDGGQWLQFESADGNGIYSGSGSTPNSIVEVENTAGLRFDQKSSIGFSSYVEIYNDYSNPVEDEFGADMFNFIRFFDKGPINENVFIGMNENEGFAISSSDNISIKGKSQLYFEGSDHEFAIQNDSVFLIMQNGRFSYISNSSASKTGIMLEGFGEIDNTGIGGNYSALRPNSLAPKALTISGLEEENVSVNANNNALSINNLGSLSLTNSGSSGGFVSGTLTSVPTRMFRDGGGGQNYVSINGGGQIRFFDQDVSRYYTLDEILKGELQEGTTAPTSTPEYKGQIYIDTATPAIYMAAGTSSSSDWLQISN